MQTNQQTKTTAWSKEEKRVFPSILSEQKPFSIKKSEFVFPLNTNSTLKAFRLTNKFINLIMTNGEKEKAFKNLQTTLFYINQRRIGKDKQVVDTKGEEKRKSIENFGLPHSEKEKRVLQLPAKSLKNTFSLSSFVVVRSNSKNKVSPLEVNEVNSSLLSSIETSLESPLNKGKLVEKKTPKVGSHQKEKGWCLCSKEKEKKLSKSVNESEKKVKSLSKTFKDFPVKKPSDKPFEKLLSKGFLKTVLLKQIAFQKEKSKVEKESLRKEKSTFLLESTLFFQQQTFSSIRCFSVGKRVSFGLSFFNQQALSFKDLSMLGESVSFFSPFFVQGSQKEKEIKKHEKQYLPLHEFLRKRNPKTNFPKKATHAKQLSCRTGLPFSLPLWVCFKSVKNKKQVSSQRVKGSTETGPSFLKESTESTSSVGKEKQKKSLQVSWEDPLRKVTKKSQKPKDNPILTGPKEKEIGGNKHPFHLRVLYKGVSHSSPLIEVRKVRKGGNTFQVPAFLKKGKSEKMGLTWLIEKGREKSRKSTLSFSESLSFNLLQSFEKSGETRQKRDQLLRLALSNRPYSRFRWW